MAKYNSSAVFDVAGVYKVNSAAPLDARYVVSNKLDLLKKSTFPNSDGLIYVYQGMQVYCEEDKVVYILTKDKVLSDFSDNITSTTDEQIKTFGWEKISASTDDIKMEWIDEDDTL